MRLLRWLSVLSVVLGLGVGLGPSAAPPTIAAGFAWTVDGTTGQDSSTCPAPGYTFKTIGAALGCAHAGDLIHVDPGTYVEHGINLSQAITLQGSGALSTVINGNGNGPVIVASAPTPGATIIGEASHGRRTAPAASAPSTVGPPPPPSIPTPSSRSRTARMRARSRPRTRSYGPWSRQRQAS